MTMKLQRRELLAGSAASLLLGCSGGSKVKRPALVSITRATRYTDDLAGHIRSILAQHRLAIRGKRVLLKPNLVEFEGGTAINTDPRMVRAAYEAFQSAGAREVRIAEGPGHRRNTMELAEAAGYFDTFRRFEDIFRDLNLDEISLVRFANPASRLDSIYLPQTALSCDLIVSMPKMKTHHWVGVTLSMKNLFGLVPGAVYGWPKNVLHWAGIDECIADLHSAFPKHFCLVDGIVGMEGNGPIQGTSKPVGVIVAGSDMVAVDATCCRIMQIDPARIRYLQLARERGQTTAANVIQIGESIESVRTPFHLIHELEGIRLRTS